MACFHFKLHRGMLVAGLMMFIFIISSLAEWNFCRIIAVKKRKKGPPTQKLKTFLFG